MREWTCIFMILNYLKMVSKQQYNLWENLLFSRICYCDRPTLVYGFSFCYNLALFCILVSNLGQLKLHTDKFDLPIIFSILVPGCLSMFSQTETFNDSENGSRFLSTLGNWDKNKAAIVKRKKNPIYGALLKLDLCKNWLWLKRGAVRIGEITVWTEKAAGIGQTLTLLAVYLKMHENTKTQEFI